MDSILQAKMESYGSVSYQDMVTNFFAKDPGTGEEWFVVALRNLREDINYEIYRNALGKLISEPTDGSVTQRQKLALTYIAVGGDPDRIKDVADETIGGLGMMSYVYGLHLLNNGAPSTLYTAGDVVDIILSLQREEGGWAIMGDYADVDTTAMTIQALAPHYDTNPEVRAAVDKALDLLGTKQLEDGSFFSFGSDNPEGTAQVILALASIGKDAMKDERFIKNGCTLQDGIDKFKIEGGGFSHTVGGNYNGLTTQQVMYCSAGYRMMKEGKGPFYLFGELKEAAEDSAKDIKHEEKNEGSKEKSPIKIYLYAATGLLFAGWIAFLLLKHKKSRNAYLSAILVCAAFAFLIHGINIQSTDDYYNGEEFEGEAITCDISIRCDTVAGEKDFIPKDGIILDRVSIKIPEGKTAMDQIYAAARQYKIQMDVRGNFVAGINYIYEKDFGDLSGWMYRVNGEFASVGAPELILNDGDFVEWLYTKDLGYDIGNDYMGK